MGNAPSKEPQGRPPQKLAKPRNATQATAGLLKPNGTSTTTTTATTTITTTNDRHSPDVGRSDIITIPYSETATPHVLADEDEDDDDERGGDFDFDKRNSFLGSSKPQRRLSLFRSKSSQEASERRRARRNTIVGAPINYLASESPAVVRANSVNTHNLESGSNRYSGLLVPENRSPAGCRASWAPDRSYETQRVLNRVQEQSTGLPRSNTFNSHFAPTPEEMQTPAWRRRSLPVQPRETQPLENAPISRTKSELSMHPPMRRRSMIQTPGVATRSVRPGRTNARSSVRRSYTATPTHPTQASFETDDSIPSLPPLPTPYRLEVDAPRVATPKDGEYSTTGAFKLGTLRITNGSPDSTPAGSTEAEPTVSRPDYFTAIPPRAKSETKVDNVQASTLSAEPRNSDVKHRESERPEYGFSSKTNVPSLSVTVPPAGPFSQYTSGLQLSPIEIDDTPLFRPSLEIQTKHTAVEDLLFDMEDDSQPETPAVEKLDVRLDSSAKGLPPQPLVDPMQPEGVKRTDSGFVSNSISVSSTSNTSLTKADSGYSSSVSLRSFRSGKKAPATEKDTGRGSTESVRKSPEVDDTEPRHALELQLPSPLSADHVRAPWAPESDKVPTPPKDLDSMEQAGRSLPRNANGDDVRAKLMSPSKARMKAARQQLPNLDIGQTGDRDAKTFEPATPIPASAKSDTSDSASPLSIGSNSQKHGRLHRLLSLRGSGFSRTPLTAHVTHAVDKQVPSVPKDIEEKLRVHTGRFPMTTKRLALRSQMSKETLKTILSVGSLELAVDDELPPTPVFFDTDSEDEKAYPASGDASLRQTINSMQSNFKQAAVSMMPNRKSITRKPVPIHKEPQGYQESVTKQTSENDGLELTSYTAVNHSLGNSVYDVAAKAQTEDQAQHGRRSMTLTEKSHQLQLRTYSLNTALSPRNSYLSPPSPSPRAVSPPKKEKSQPPVSMATRSFRTPPPRSPLSPRGPAVLRKKSREVMRSPMTSPSDAPPVPTLTRRGSLDSIRRVAAASASNYRAADWDPQAHQDSLGSQLSFLDNSYHNSLSSVPSDRIHRSARAHQSGQHPNDAVLKQQSNIIRDQQQGVYVPQTAHQGPRPRSLSQSDHWHRPKFVEEQQWKQHARYPPYVPRGRHRRNQSAGNQAHPAMGNPPYRVLHSYNSPAYRNAPIWG